MNTGTHPKTGFLILVTVGVVLGQWKFKEDVDLNGLEECEAKYEKVGCYRDNQEARALSEFIFTDRQNIKWEAGKWEKYLKRLACRCAKETGAKGYSHFGLQFYGECWSDTQAAEKFDRYGKSDDCYGFAFKKCSDGSNGECVGAQDLNYVYRVVDDGGASGSGSGVESA